MSSQHIAVIHLAQRNRALELAESLTAHSVEAAVSQTSDEFYHLLNHQRVDLVVIEHELPGFLSGLEILERLFTDLLRPMTLLLGTLPGELQERARRIGIDRVMRAAEETATVRSAVAGLLASSRHTRQVIIPPQARQIVQRSEAIRPLPQLLVRLCGYLDHETVSMDALATDISVDPRATAELLKLTNSTALGLRREVTKVVDAVKFLGVRRTIALVLSSSLLEAQAGLAGALPDTFRSWYNTRSLLIASAASTFARDLDDVSPESAYILGLLQDIGILVLAQTCGERYLRALRRVREVAQLRLEITEKEDFGITHADVSAALLRKWELPQSLTGLVLCHHRQATADRSPTEQRFLHAMQVGEAVANLADHCTPQRSRLLNQLLATYGEGQAEACKSCLAEAVARAAESSRLFNVPVPDEEELRRLLQKASAEPLRDEQAVLVVKEDAETATRLRELLQPLGWEVLSCSSLSEAKQLASCVKAVLCDLHVGPKWGSKGGLDVVRGLREEGCPHPLIMIGGDRGRETVVECIAAGITDYLPDPCDDDLLLKKLAKHAGLPDPAPVR